ncbi:MAG: SGNH/GDSL hydrolase family protein [Oscillospiraceae bacterium]|jgi:lysophospholipase L1-like esterase|nr:SGNH/GDSL hydrolase family protein [Oscillospiraceae bacterium]
MTGLVPNARILFTGDSITDAGRSYLVKDSLGDGYVSLFSEAMKALHPGEPVKIFNTGVAGDTALNLCFRLREDCVDLNPDYIVMLIGVNDAWNGYRGREAFERVYRRILGEILSKTRAELLLMEPFLLEATSEMQRNCVIENLNGYLPAVREMTDAVRALAAEYRLPIIPLAEIARQETEAGTPPEALAADGIHPALRMRKIMTDQIMIKLGIEGYAPKFGPYAPPEPVKSPEDPRRICVNARQKTLTAGSDVYQVTGDTEFYLRQGNALTLVSRGQGAMFCKDYNIDLQWFSGRIIGERVIGGFALTAAAVFIEPGEAGDWAPTGMNAGF